MARVKVTGQINTCRQTAQANFYNYQIAHKLHQKGFRNKDTEPIQGACQIICIKSYKIRTNPRIPGIKYRIPAPQFVEKIRQKRKILMIHINI